MNLILGACGYFKSRRNKIYKELLFIQQGAQFQNLFFFQLSKSLQSMYAKFIIVQIWGTEFVSYSLYSGKGLSLSALGHQRPFPVPVCSLPLGLPGRGVGRLGCPEPALSCTVSPTPLDSFSALSPIIVGNAAWQPVFQC